MLGPLSNSQYIFIGLIDFSRAVAVILSKVAALPLASRIQSTFTFRFDACEIRLGTSAGRADGGGSNECYFQGSEKVSPRFVTGFMEWLNLAVNISFFFLRMKKDTRKMNRSRRKLKLFKSDFFRETSVALYSIL